MSRRRLPVRRWAGLALAVLLITPTALGVHEWMLEGLHIAFPSPQGLPAWPSFLGEWLTVAGLIAFCRLAAARLAQHVLVVRCLAVALLCLTLRETFRLLVIELFLTHAWAFQPVQAAPRMVYFLFVCSASVAVAATQRRQSVAGGAAASLLIALMGALLVKPLVGMAFAPALSALTAAGLDRPDLYQEPYGVTMLVPIYVTFIEPVIACLVIAAWVWPALSPRRWVRLLQFVVLIMCMKGSVLHTLLDSFWIPGPMSAGFLSEGQFALETLVMAVLTGLAWQLLRQDRRDGSPAG